MGILRADRITGLGGADAITGSVFLGGKQRIVIDSHDDFNFSNNDFTLECWINFSGFNGDGFDTIAWGGSDGTATTRSIQWDYKNTSNELRLVTSVSNSGTVYASSFTALKDVWYHLAVCRSSSDLKLFVNGTRIGSTHNIGSNVIDYDTVPFNIGMRPGNDDRGVIGHISNFRIINGTALYTSNFSVPTTRLTSVTNTALLCCQSSSNIFEDQSLVKKKFTSHRNNTNDALPQASRFTPNSPVGFSTTTDVGSQYGSTFDGFGSFATSTYMVPPGGNTRERNRGRGLAGGGWSPSLLAQIYSVEIQSDGTSADFGDLTDARRGTGAAASHTRAVWAGGYSPGYVNIMDFVTIASTANALDFGDLDNGRFETSGVGNDTRGVFGPSENPAVSQNVIQYITFATTGNATDFGDSTIDTGTKKQASVCSTTRGIFAGGQNVPSPSNFYDLIEYITTATTGNATDFGDLLAANFMMTGVSDATRGVIGGGNGPNTSGANFNVIQYVTIATTGNATDFGDLTTANQRSAGMSNSVRGLFSGGGTPNASTAVNSIDKITIQTTGNAVDFGDYIGTAVTQAAGCSDSHGGLS